MAFSKIFCGFVWVLSIGLYSQSSFAEIPNMICELADPKVKPKTFQLPGSCDQRKLCVENVVCFHANVGRARVKSGKDTAFNVFCPSDTQGKCPIPSECLKAKVEIVADVPFSDDSRRGAPTNTARSFDVGGGGFTNPAPLPKDTADAGNTAGNSEGSQ